MTTKELARTLSAGMFKTTNGFYCDGIFYNGYAIVDETTIEFTYTKLSYVGADVFNKTRININRVAGVGKIRAYNEREGYYLPYNNVILK